MSKPVALLSEKDLQAGIVRAAKALGWLVFYDTMPIRSVPGWPDLVMLHVEKKRLYVWELKNEQGIVSAAQQQWLDAWVAVLSAIVSPKGTHVSVAVVRPSGLEEAYAALV